MDLDLRRVLKIARHWWWLLVLGLVLGGSVAYIASARQQPQYRASATLQVNPAQTSSSTDFSALQGSKALADTYRQLITTRTILEPVRTKLTLPYDIKTFEGRVSASIVGTTQLIRVSVSDPNPQRAAEIANAIANQFVEHTKARAAELAGPYRATLDQQITQVSQQIDQTQTQIQQLQQTTSANAAGVADKINALQAQLQQYQQSYRNLLVAANDMDRTAAASQSQVTIEDSAVAPDAPYTPLTKRNALLGAFAGLFVAIGGIALLEYLDNTVKGDLDFAGSFGVPLLSTIQHVAKLPSGGGQLYVARHPRSSAAEAMRLLRTNLEFAAATKEIVSLAVTSSTPGEGKSTVAANLGVTMAQAGFTVVIVDADLRKPSQHRIWDLANGQGLTTLLTHPDLSWQSVAANVAIPHLRIIPSGPQPPNPADLLSLDRFRVILRELSEAADVVIVDTPPVLAVSDPLTIASAVDGMILVGYAGRTRIEALRQALAMFGQQSLRVVGIVLNHGTKGTAGYYYDYGESYGSGNAGAVESASLPMPTNGHHPVEQPGRRRAPLGRLAER